MLITLIYLLICFVSADVHLNMNLLYAIIVLDLGVVITTSVRDVLKKKIECKYMKCKDGKV